MSQITKRALAASLKKLLSSTTLDKITIKDIVEDCGVNRQTFYYHFQDVYDLMKWLFEEEADQVLGNKKTYGTWQEGFLASFHYIENNRPLVLNAYHSMGREHLESYLYKITFYLLMDVVNATEGAETVEDSDKEFLCDFYKYAFVGLVLEWIRNGMKQKPEMIVEKLSQLISGDFQRGLSRFHK